MNKTQFFILLTLLVFLCAAILPGCSFRPPPPCIKNGYSYGTAKDLIISNKWYSCYQRGLSYSEGGCWDQAISQFFKAIHQRPNDQWRARSYGMHVLDEYFPHREMGIVYLHQGLIQDAIQELTLSLSSTESGKAKYYLNRARKLWLENTGMDTTPPMIQFPDLSSISQAADTGHENLIPGNNILYTNSSPYHLKGAATDDYYISGILINEQPLFIDLAQPEIHFQKDIPLKIGINTLALKAVDLVGKEYIKEIRIFLDQQGPTLFFSPSESLESEDIQTSYHSQTSGEITIQGTAYDEGGLKRLIINKKEIPLEEADKIKDFVCIIPFSSHPAFYAMDRSGNVTEGALDWIGKVIPANKKEIKICYNENSFAIATNSAQGQDENQGIDQPPEKGLTIYLEECPHLVYNPRVVFTAWVESTKEISDLWISDLLVNDESSLSGISGTSKDAESLLSSKENADLASLLRRFFLGGRTILYFTYTKDNLIEGENHFSINAKDIKGKTVRKMITVDYQKREIEKIGNRWHLAIFPFIKQKKTDYLFSSSPPRSMDMLESALDKSFADTQRFMLLNRRQIDILIQQLQLNLSDLVDIKTAPRIGKFLPAEVALMGYMYEGWDGQDRCLEIIANLVDAETSQILSTKSVYNRWKTRQDEEFLLSGLALLFVQEFPLLQGNILDIQQKWLKIDLTGDDLIKSGMRILIYSPDDNTILGEARIDEVFKEYSYANPLQDIMIQNIKIKNKVITK